MSTDPFAESEQPDAAHKQTAHAEGAGSPAGRPARGGRVALAEALGISFQDASLLQSALTHRSFSNEHPERSGGLPSNERLEFLGDAVLNMLTASWLYLRFPESSEGELTAMRAALVKTPTLARFARLFHLGSHIRLSRGADSPAERDRPALLADTFEAVLGAVYLDQGLDTARAFIEPLLQQEVDRLATGQGEVDYRTRLQERIQAAYSETPIYRTIEVTGPEHRRLFTVEVVVQGARIGTGSGSSKQSAAQDAARQALEALDAPGQSEGAAS